MIKKKLLLITLSLLFAFIIINISASAEYSYYDHDYENSTDSSDAFQLLIVLIILIIIGIIIWIGVTIWTYRDAKRRGENAALWAIIVFFGSFIGLIVWLVVRPPIGSPPKYNSLNLNFNIERRPERICPTCGRIIPFDAIICPYCTRRF